MRRVPARTPRIARQPRSSIHSSLSSSPRAAYRQKANPGAGNPNGRWHSQPAIAPTGFTVCSRCGVTSRHSGESPVCLLQLPPWGQRLSTNTPIARVRAEGLEPSSSLEQWHLKPSRMPIPPRPQRCRSYRPARQGSRSVVSPRLGSAHRKEPASAIRGVVRGPIDSDGCRLVANIHRGRSTRSPGHSTTWVPWTRPSPLHHRRIPRNDYFPGSRVSTSSTDPSYDASSRYRLSVSTTHRRRPALIALAIVAACGCLALGWWQWTRFQSVSGTFQNLGYALQWPMFAWFCIYAYRKFVRYEEVPPEPPNAMTEIPPGLLPERPTPAPQPSDDPALQEYNAYLAELAKHDADRQNRNSA